jgi:hypothetical protein
LVKGLRNLLDHHRLRGLLARRRRSFKTFGARTDSLHRQTPNRKVGPRRDAHRSARWLIIPRVS